MLDTFGMLDVLIRAAFFGGSFPNDKPLIYAEKFIYSSCRRKINLLLPYFTR